MSREPKSDLKASGFSLGWWAEASYYYATIYATAIFVWIQDDKAAVPKNIKTVVIT